MSIPDNKVIAEELIKYLNDMRHLQGQTCSARIRSGVEQFFSQLRPVYLERACHYTAAIGVMVMGKFEECYRIYYDAADDDGAIKSAFYWTRYQQCKLPDKFGKILYVRITEYAPKPISGRIPGAYARPEGRLVYTWVNTVTGGLPADVGVAYDFSKEGGP